MKLSFNKLVKNKYLLYLLALISFVVIINNMLKQKFAAILFFYLICVITFNYSKNNVFNLSELKKILRDCLHYNYNLRPTPEKLLKKIASLSLL